MQIFLGKAYREMAGAYAGARLPRLAGSKQARGLREGLQHATGNKGVVWPGVPGQEKQRRGNDKIKSNPAPGHKTIADVQGMFLKEV